MAESVDAGPGRRDPTQRVDDVWVVAQLGARVGECPVYDALDGTLYGVDIPAGRLWRLRPDGVLDHRDLGEPVGSVALVAGGGFLLAAKSGLHVLDRWDATPQRWRPIEPERPTQCNDGRCDPAGRFVVGTATTDQSCLGALYVVAHDGSVRQLIDGIGMSNGLDWSPDGRWLYYVDSIAGSVTRFDWDAERAQVSGPFQLITVPSAEGLPDGLTVDEEGCLWLAVWGAGEVRRYAPDGRHIATVPLPTPHVTSCTFGGAESNQLFVTTASAGLAAGDPGSDHAGDVFAVSTSSVGRPPTPFRFDDGARP